METLSTYNKFGKKIKELIQLVHDNEDWKKYVDESTAGLIEQLLTVQNLSVIIQNNKDLNYSTLRSKYMVAIDRIKAKNNKFTRNGKSDKAKEFFDLIESTPDWKKPLTEIEIKYVESFLVLKNFHEVARQLKAKPGNVAGKLYGTNQRAGVMQKIERMLEN
jgi:hypothetical protein